VLHDVYLVEKLAQFNRERVPERVSYADAHRYRIGANYNELPVNRPKVEVHSYAKDGHLRHFYNDAKTPVYAPNSFGGPKADPVRAAERSGWTSDGELVRSAYTLRVDDDDFGQAGTLVREVFDDAQRKRLVETVVGQYNALKHEQVRERFLWHWNSVDRGTADRIKAQILKPIGAA
jgi:catalase